MSTDAAETDDALAERVEQWLAREMPIIQMHGGTSSVRRADLETGEVVVELGGGCSGCGVADITTGNIEDKPHWYLLGWGNATFDAVQTIQPLLASDGALSSYANDELDRLLDEAQSLPSESN